MWDISLLYETNTPFTNKIKSICIRKWRCSRAHYHLNYFIEHTKRCTTFLVWTWVILHLSVRSCYNRGRFYRHRLRGHISAGTHWSSISLKEVMNEGERTKQWIKNPKEELCTFSLISYTNCWCRLCLTSDRR